MKKILSLIAVVMLAAATGYADGNYALSTTSDVGVTGLVVNAASTTNITRNAFKLYSVPGGTSTLALQFQGVAANAGTSNVILTLKWGIGDGTNFPTTTYVTNALNGTNAASSVSFLSAQAYRDVKVTAIQSQQTNAATVSVKFGQHR